MNELRHIYTCVDIGSDSIKIVVCELYRGRYNLLATSTVKAKGVKKGLINDVVSVKNCIKSGFNEIESMLGFKIRKVIAIIPSYFAEFNMIKGEISITNEDKIITSTDVINVFQVAMKNHIDYTKEMVTIIPVDFALDNGITKDPLNKQSSTLKTRAILATTPKKIFIQLSICLIVLGWKSSIYL